MKNSRNGKSTKSSHPNSRPHRPAPRPRAPQREAHPLEGTTVALDIVSLALGGAGVARLAVSGGGDEGDPASGMDPHEPTRERRLLLHHREIDKLQAAAAQKGLTIVPVRLYFKNGRVKLEIALGRGKNVHDRRDDLKERDLNRDTARQLADYKRG